MSGYDDRRERLCATAARVFAAQGWAATSMRDLARAAGISLAGIYYYVRGKEDLLYQIQRGCFERVTAGAHRALDGEAAAEARLAAFIRHHVTFFATHMDEMKVLAHEADTLGGTMGEEILRLKRAYVDLCVGLLAGLEGGAGDTVTRDVAAYALFGMMNWIHTWYRPDGTVAPAELADIYTRLFLDGARSLAPAAVRAH